MARPIEKVELPTGFSTWLEVVARGSYISSPDGYGKLANVSSLVVVYRAGLEFDLLATNPLKFRCEACGKWSGAVNDGHMSQVDRKSWCRGKTVRLLPETEDGNPIQKTTREGS